MPSRWAVLICVDWQKKKLNENLNADQRRPTSPFYRLMFGRSYLAQVRTVLAAARCALLGAHRQHIGTGSERRSGTKNCSDADERGTRSGDVDLTEIGIFAASAATTSYSDHLAKRPSVLLMRDKRCSAPGTLLQTCCALSRRRACTAGRVAAALLHCQISAALQCQQKPTQAS
jgi:hypothetical protein